MKNGNSNPVEPPSLYMVLKEADLLQYHDKLRTVLKLRHAGDLAYTEEKDLAEVGMSRPEQKRLRREQQRLLPGGAGSKLVVRLRRVFGKGAERPAGPLPTTSAYLEQSEQHVIQPEAVELCRELGRGEFGVVYQGSWHLPDGQVVQVAIKRVLPEKLKNNPTMFLQEAAVMSKMRNEHLVRMYGVVLDTKAVMLVSELAPYGSLLECLRRPAWEEPFGVDRLCEFAGQVGAGMRYLHSQRLIHRDLAARNLLVFALTQVKIADFGLSRSLGVGEDYYRSEFAPTMRLPIAWCAPEAINMLRFTPASDVYAFGVTLWEMFSYGELPWKGYSGSQILHTVDTQRKTLDRPDFCPTEFYELMQRCWRHEPDERPTFDEIAHKVPEMMPQLLVTVTECHNNEPLQLQFDKGEIVILLDRDPNNVEGEKTFWHGALRAGKCGLFKPAETVAYLGAENPTRASRLGPLPLYQNAGTPQLEARAPPKERGLIGRKCSAKSNSLEKERRKLLISEPQGDLRHTCHVGVDGSAFGLVPLAKPADPGPPHSAAVSPARSTNSAASGQTAAAVPFQACAPPLDAESVENLLRTGYDVPQRPEPPALPPKPAARIKPTQQRVSPVDHMANDLLGKTHLAIRGNSLPKKRPELIDPDLGRPRSVTASAEFVVADTTAKLTGSPTSKTSADRLDEVLSHLQHDISDFSLGSTATFSDTKPLLASCRGGSEDGLAATNGSVVRSLTQSETDKLIKRVDSEHRKAAKELAREFQQMKRLRMETSRESDQEEEERCRKRSETDDWTDEAQQAYKLLVECGDNLKRVSPMQPATSPTSLSQKSSVTDTESTVIRVESAQCTSSVYGNLDEEAEPDHKAPPLPPKNGRRPIDYINNTLVGFAPRQPSEELELPVQVEQRRVMEYENSAVAQPSGERPPQLPPKPKARQSRPSLSDTTPCSPPLAPAPRPPVRSVALNSPQMVRFAPTVQQSALFSGFPKDEVVKF